MEHPSDMRGHDEHLRARRLRWAFYGFLGVAAFFLIGEHRTHLLGVLPYIILLLCPLLHVFGHGGHQSHDSSSSVKEPK